MRVVWRDRLPRAPVASSGGGPAPIAGRDRERACQRLWELAAKDGWQIRGGRPRVPRIGRIAAAQAPVSPKPDLRARNPLADPLRGGWYPWDPYQYRDYRRGVPVLTGFDVEIERALERILGVEILLPETAWNAHLKSLAAGTADIAAGATRSEARSAFAYFSKPYRSETDS